MMPYKRSNVGFMAIEVKKVENCKSWQLLSDRSEHGKRMIDEQDKDLLFLVCGKIFCSFILDSASKRVRVPGV